MNTGHTFLVIMRQMIRKLIPKAGEMIVQVIQCQTFSKNVICNNRKKSENKMFVMRYHIKQMNSKNNWSWGKINK